MRAEYPRPGFVREQWQSLNGEWDFEMGGEKTSILVPYVPQSAKSGIGKRITWDEVTYERGFIIPDECDNKVVLLHFGAVDYQCSVFVNGNKVGEHKGGNSSFHFDITRFLTSGEQKLRVEVYDPLQDETIPRGKQFWKEESEFIWYTPSTGIWQSVWLEAVDKAHFEWIKFTPDVDKGEVEIRFKLSRQTLLPCKAQFDILFGEETVCNLEYTCTQHQNRVVANVYGNRAMAGSFHFTGRYWTPENPVLFDVKAVLQCQSQVDSVDSYFGMRKVHIENGKFYLNNVPYYNKLLLDQGYWEESLITAPTDLDYKTDIEKFKAMGFNGCRKHEKVEDPRFLYWADKLGFLVWVGMSSFWSYTPETAADFTKEWLDVIDRDYNHPSIVVWGMLNESWGVPRIYNNPMQQSFSTSLYHLARSMDQSRLVVGNDGWEQTVTDICALHSYKHGTEEDISQQQLFKDSLTDISFMHKIVEKLPYAKGYEYNNEPVMLTEFGGISLADESNKNWGYTVSTSPEEFLATYSRVMNALYASDLLCGYCYTQATDVEQETNGLLNKDHSYKFPPEKIKEINDRKKTTFM